ncbi:hypothetical protein ACFVRU_41005 [Streptomyces sp. NPDC057927]
MKTVYARLTVLISVEVDDGFENVINEVPYLMDGGLLDSIEVNASTFKGNVVLQVEDWDSELLETIVN